MNRFVAAVSAALLLAAPAYAGVTEEDLANDTASTGDVLTNGMGRDLQRHSPLTMINKENVGKMVPV
jgi:alcohol dehydrogenase (cytochrome c)